MPERQRITIPYAPRRWARKLHASFLRWSALVLHRRAGKTTAILNHHQRAACDDKWELARLKFLLPDTPDDKLKPLLQRRVYWHVMPSYHQAKVTGAWDILKEIARPIPGTKPNESEMLMTYPGGNKVQLIGADKPDKLRGPGLSGLSLDEYSDIAPNAFSEVLSKSLADHLGYAIFSGTIKGKDQLYHAYQAAKGDPEWFSTWQDVDTSLQTESGPTITALERAMQDDRKLILQGLMTQAEFDQEWYLSPEAAIKGAIYGTELAAARVEGRITRVPYDPALPVDTDWDLGIGDSMSVWFSQSLRTGEVRLIDYYETTGDGLPQVAKVLQGKGYVYGTHWAPHDIAVRELGTGKTRLETAAGFGLKFEMTPRIHGDKGMEVEEGIRAARLLLPRCWFDETKTAAGVEALLHYRRDYNSRLNEFKPEPVHNWASHGSDAFRGLAVRHQIPKDKRRPAVDYGSFDHGSVGWMAS
jgi:phage terminase large subunit